MLGTSTIHLLRDALFAVALFFAFLLVGRFLLAWLRRKSIAAVIKNAADAQAKLSAIREGKADMFPIQGKERVKHVGFTRDGRWMWCGTERGLLVFDWQTTPLENGAELTSPTWRYDTPLKSDHSYSQAILAVSEDPARGGLVFGDSVGRVYHIDLATGQARRLLTLPGERRISELCFSTDGHALGIASSSGQRMKGLHGIWEVWSYPRLVAGSMDK